MGENHSKNNILVIKLSAFGDFVQAIPAFQSLRKHHQDEYLILMTSPAFISLAESLDIFDEIIPHERFKFSRLKMLFQFRKQLKAYHFKSVYDLQLTTRTAIYFYLMLPFAPKWAGVARYAKISYKRDFLETMPAFMRHELLLCMMGVIYEANADKEWVDRLAPPNFSLPKSPYFLIIFGAAPSRPEKCWHYKKYAELANILVEKKITPVLIGGQNELEISKKIEKLSPKVVNLVGKTSLQDIAILGKSALHAVGNDTGAMHLLGQVGTPLLILFSNANNPELCMPQGFHDFIQVDNLAGNDLPVKTVAKRLGLLYKDSHD